MDSEISNIIQGKEEEVRYFKGMLIGKLETGELNAGTLERIVDHIYTIGHYIGHCRGEQYKRELIEEYQRKINELEGELYAKR